MDNIILGLLLLQPRTIYQLRKRIGKGLNLMYSCSTGSIQAAIGKLLKINAITQTEITEDGKLKKIYSITDEGKRLFFAWLNGPINSEPPKNQELTKIYFMGFSAKQTNVAIVEEYINNLKVIYADLERINKDGEGLKPEYGNNDIFFYQMQTVSYALEFIRFNINWFDGLLNKIRSKDDATAIS